MDGGGPFSLSRSFERHLRAKNLSGGTVASSLVGVRQFTAFLQPLGRELEGATRADLEAFSAELLRRRSPATASTRYKQLQALYRWLEGEEEIALDPMARVKPPIVPDQPVPVVPEDVLRRLLAACAGKSFEARRDAALVTFLLDTGARRARWPACGSPTWTSTWTSPWSSARAAGSGPCHSDTPPRSRSTATSGASPPQGRGPPMVVARALWPPDRLGAGPDAAAP